MTMPADLARKQPAEIAAGNEPIQAKDEVSPAARILLRLAAFLLVLAALFQMVCAATGYRP